MCIRDRKYSEHLIEWVGMLQLEVVQRILARPKTKEYGKLSVLLQAYFDIKQIMRLSPASFYPPPKVSSAVIRMIPKHTTNCLLYTSRCV